MKASYLNELYTSENNFLTYLTPVYFHICIDESPMKASYLNELYTSENYFLIYLAPVYFYICINESPPCGDSSNKKRRNEVRAIKNK